MHVAREPVARFLTRVRHPVNADVNDDDSGLHHVGSDELGPTDGGDEHVGLARERREVRGSGVANGHGAVCTRTFLEGEERDGLPDNE